jgi:epoxide hydrolase 4
MSTTEDRASGELREGYAEVGDQRLHYVEAGDGPLVVLLHGFPEFWYGWRLQIKPLAAAGFRVVAPDTRGYNLSSKPDGVKAYDVAGLAADIRGLIHERGAGSALLAGHDWGGSIAWATAMNNPRSWTGWPSSTRPTRGSCRRDCTTPGSCRESRNRRALPR